MFDGFRPGRVDLWDVTLRFQHSGHGPAVLLLHGPDRPHTTWHRVAPLLAKQFTVVCPDLPDPSRDNHETALDCVALMKSLGHDEFSVAGYGPAAHLALHLALTHPTLVERLALLDAEPPATTAPPTSAPPTSAPPTPTGTPPAASAPAAPSAASARAASAPAAAPSAAAASAPVTAPSTTAAPAAAPSVAAAPAAASARPAAPFAAPASGAAASNPVPVATSAGSVRRRFFRPVLVVWAEGGGRSNSAAGWRPWCEDVRSVGIHGGADGGRHLAEDAPEELVAALGRFLDHGTSPVS